MFLTLMYLYAEKSFYCGEFLTYDTVPFFIREIRG